MNFIFLEGEVPYRTKILSFQQYKYLSVSLSLCLSVSLSLCLGIGHVAMHVLRVANRFANIAHTQTLIHTVPNCVCLCQKLTFDCRQSYDRQKKRTERQTQQVPSSQITENLWVVNSFYCSHTTDRRVRDFFLANKWPVAWQRDCVLLPSLTHTKNSVPCLTQKQIF